MTPSARVGIAALLAAAAVSVVNASHAADIVVAVDGSGDAATLADAVRVAAAGDRVLLGDGIHTGPGAVRVVVTEPISIVSQSGDASACRIDGGGSAHVLEYVGVVPEPPALGGGFVLSGVTIEHAREGAVRVFGGGAPEIVDCVFASSSGSLWGAVYARTDPGLPVIVRRTTFRFNKSGANGSALLCEAGEVSLVDCVFNTNQSDGGGAFVHLGSSDVTSSTLVDGCVFEDNAGRIGGGVYAIASRVTFRDTRFDVNETSFTGGGAFVSVTGDMPSEFIGCEFVGNTSLLDGGGLYLAVRPGGVTTLDDCLFDHGVARRGGGTFVETGRVVFTSARFVGNSATGTGGDFGEGGALRVLEGAHVTLSGCTLSGNVATRLGGALRSHGTLSVNGSTLVGNIAGDGSDFSVTGPTTITTSLVALGRGTSVHCEAEIPDVSCSDFFGNDVSSWSPCIEGLATMDGNLEADPRFCDVNPVLHRSWKLLDDSPCLVAGCGPIGAWPSSCGSSPVNETSWGRIKSVYRADRLGGAAR